MNGVRDRGAQRSRQAGAALLAIFFLLGMVGLAIFVSKLAAGGTRADREQITAQALAKAKIALIAYAAAVPVLTCSDPVNCPRPGDLPCPDTNNNGENDDGPCGDEYGSDQPLRLGRLPWKTLGISDLRDGNGERLWYAVSTKFKNNARYNPLNSDTTGTITVRDSSGAVVYNGAAQSGVAALIIAPGQALQRFGSATFQDRSCSSPAVCKDPANYLDVVTIDVATIEDNAGFLDSDAVDGFIAGPILDASKKEIVNDRILGVTVAEIMQVVERRVINEVRACLTAYAVVHQDMYPWAAQLDPGAPVQYAGVSGIRFGRIPDPPFFATVVSAPLFAGLSWQAGCRLEYPWWTLNAWKEMVFYGLSDAYKPALLPPAGCPSCLTVNPPVATSNKRIVVLAAGKKLDGRNRDSEVDKGTLLNYLEGENLTPDDVFERRPAAALFNDQTASFPDS